MASLLLLALFTALCHLAWTQDTQVLHGVAGIDTINIQCFSEAAAEDPGYDGYFWKINGSVYGALHLPREYKVCQSRCNLATLTIPVVLAEMDGHTFQCFGINYQTNTVHEGRVTELEVTVLRGNFNVENSAHVRDVLEFDYTQFSVGPVNTTIGWTYMNLTCQPTVFMVEGYNDTATITTGQPVLTLNSTSTMTLLPNISTVPLYLRLLAYDETGTSCAEDSATRYHTVDSNVPAPVVVSWSPEGVACVGNPVEMSSGLDYSSLEVLWPETPYTPHQLCYCPPFEGDQHLFSRCINTSSCDTHYSVTVNSDSVCFAGLQHELTSIPVYFTLLQPCGGGRCIIRSLLAQYIIMSPPPAPEVSYTNNRVCFSCPHTAVVETYLVNITDVYGASLSLSGHYNSSRCFPLTSDLYPNICSPITVSVAAINRAGRSERRSNIVFINGDPQTCFQSSATALPFQLYLHGITSCPDWVNRNTLLKLADISRELAVFIEQRCNCSLPPSLLTTSSHFTCVAELPQHVVYRASVQLSSLPVPLDRSMLVDILETWPVLHRAVLVQGERLSVEESCAVVILSPEEQQCTLTFTPSEPQAAAAPLNMLLVTVLPVTVVVLLIAVAVVMAVVMVHLGYKRKFKKKYLSSQLPTAADEKTEEGVFPSSNLFRVSSGSACSQNHDYEVIAPRTDGHTPRPGEAKGTEYQFTECPAYTTSGQQLM